MVVHARIVRVRVRVRVRACGASSCLGIELPRRNIQSWVPNVTLG